MSLAAVTPRPCDHPAFGSVSDPILGKVSAELQSCFGVDFALWDGDEGRLLRRADDQPPGDEMLLSALVQSVARERGPQFIGDEDCVVQLAIPLRKDRGPVRVAVATFATAHLEPDEDASSAAKLLGVSSAETVHWVNRQSLWSPDALLRLGRALLDKIAAETKAARLEGEIESVSENLASTYEEISLLYDMIRNLRISSSEQSLAEAALNLVHEHLPAESVVLQYLPVAEEGSATYKARTRTLWLTDGDPPVDCDRFSELVQTLGLHAGSNPYVANGGVTSEPDWPVEGIRQLIITPLCEGDNLFAWLASFNHTDGGEFGTVEASLLSSLGVMLGIHSGNRELYRQQAEFLADVVRAMSSAIDAKDPYTCGHSDRVARIAVRLAKEMGLEGDALSTIYMAGLLHDIGKIGVDEKVLRKPSGLTDEEYEHIKRHPALGYKILVDIKRLSDVLPGVLHHHEQWNGQGYPHGLAAEEIPEIARIVGVADAYDAMTSDRPYRKGMPLERVHRIFREDAGRYWDARVLDAYFRVQDDVSQLCCEERADLTLDVEQWL